MTTSAVEMIAALLAAACEASCRTCFYRREEWRDGGHCYMWGKAPERPTCHLWELDRTKLPGHGAPATEKK